MFIKRTKWFEKKNKCNFEYELSVLLKCVNSDKFTDEKPE